MKLNYYLFASEQNSYKPWILTTPALVLFCFVIWALRLLLPGISIAAPGIDPQDLMTRINAERTQRFIPALITYSKLITAATGKAQDMMARSYFAHVDPDGNYVWPRIEATGYKPYLTLGENLAMDFTSASEMMAAWMNSPGHRANIENEKFVDQGVSTISGTFEPNHNTIIAVSLFGALYNPPPSPVAKTYPTPVYQTPKIIKPKPTPALPPAPAPPEKSSLIIFPDIKVNTTVVSGKILVNLDVVIGGNPSLVTSRLKTQSITLVAGKQPGEFVGSFTFDQTEILGSQTVSIEARDKTGAKLAQDFRIRIDVPALSGAAQDSLVPIPVTNEAAIIKVLRIIFGIFGAIYVIFLVIDAVIIHRAKIKRTGIHSWPHLLVLLLIAAITLLGR
ncbi:MAG: CAP domain-containing protein [Candidatus Doudnabacteria bacterium]